MQPYYSSDNITIYHQDCFIAMRLMPESSIDTIITDPPYALEFMGKNWDKAIPPVRYWKAALRVAKPGATMLAFGGTRTHHRLMCNIEDAGWEIRDVMMWVYASGFPKSHDISKAIDKAAGAERKVVGRYQPPEMDKPWNLQNASDERDVDVFASSRNNLDITAPATEAAQLWHGWGTALKPAWEPIIVAQKSRDGTFAQNALKWGVAGLWVDGGRIGIETITTHSRGSNQAFPKRPGETTVEESGRSKRQDIELGEPRVGRWPANLTHDGSPEILACFPDSPGQIARARTDNEPQSNTVYGKMNHVTTHPEPRVDTSKSAARFFYCAKASKRERTCNGQVENGHATVKPITLMRYLCRLTKTPTGGVILDPFCGSGSTLLAGIAEGREVIGIDNDDESCRVAMGRVMAAP